MPTLLVKRNLWHESCYLSDSRILVRCWTPDTFKEALTTWEANKSSLENIDLLQTRILICGLGSIGRRHARVFNQLSPDIQLSALRSGHGSQCTCQNYDSSIF